MRRVIASLFVVVLLAAAGYAGYWFYVAGQLRAGLGPWAEARRAEGYTVRWDRAAVEGFPAALRLRFDEAAFGAARPVPYEIGGATVTLTAAPWDLRRWRVAAPRGAHLAVPGQAAEIEAAGLDGTVTLDTPEGMVIEAAARGLAGRGGTAGLRIAAAEMRVTLPAKPPASHLDPALGLALRLTQLALPRAVPPFGNTVETASLAATLKGALPPGPLPRSLAAWRDEGGTVELRESRIRWGALAAEATGTLALDAALQPTGALTATVSNQDAVIDAAVAAGGLRARDASLVKIFLGLMARRGPDGEKRITVPVSLQDGRLYLGPVEIARLPRVTWQ